MSYFITKDVQIPLVLNFYPEDRAWLVNLTASVEVNFNKVINTFTVDTGSFYVTGPDGKVPGVIEFGGDEATTATFRPSVQYRPGHEYTVILTSHIQDNVGNAIEGLSWSFTTGIFGDIGYDGGTIASPDFQISFSRGSLDSDLEIGANLIPPDKVNLPAEPVFAGVAFDILPETRLTREAILTLVMPDSVAGTSDEPKIYFYESLTDTWEHIGGTISGNEISAAINKLGRFGLFFGYSGEQVSVDILASVALIPRVIKTRGRGIDNCLKVSFTTSRPTDVVAKIYDTNGRLIKTLADGLITDIGSQLLDWDGQRSEGGYANDGLYILVIEAEGEKIQKTFVILNK